MEQGDKMKPKTLHFVSYWLESLIIAIAIILMVASDTATAQNRIDSVPNFVINGLFTPNASQQFFEAGSDNLEAEARILNNPEQYFDEDLLKIDPAAIKAMRQYQSDPSLWKNNPDRKLELEMFINPN